MGKTLVGVPLPISAITANHAASAYPVTNLRTSQVKGGDRAHSAHLGLWRMDVDMGALIQSNALGLLYTNATENAGIRWKQAATQAALSSAPVYDTVPFGPCLRFDGVDDFASATDAAWTGLTSWSISCRFRPSVLRRQGIIALANGSGDIAAIGQIAGTGAIRAYAHASLLPNLVSSVIPPTGEFTRVTFTYNAGTQVAQLIVNAALAAQATSVAPFIASPEFLEIGTGVGSDAFLGGLIDDVRVWDHARTVANELGDIQAELTGSETGLVYYCKFNEGTGASSANAVSGGALTSISGALWHMPEQLWWSPDLHGLPYSHNYSILPIGVGTARWIRAEVIDAANPDGYFAAGRLVVMNAWITSRGRLYGDRFGTRERSERSYLHGATPVIGSGMRQTQAFTVISTSIEELRKAQLRLRHAAGASSPVCVLHDHEDVAMRHWNSIYGLLGDEMEMVEPVRGIGELSMEIEEL